MSYERLTIPPGTQLLSIERLFSGAWAIWIHTNDNELRKTHWKRNGTFLLLNNTGSVDRITVSGGELVDVIEVMPPNGGDDEEKE
jgi:hypothetical protein